MIADKGYDSDTLVERIRTQKAAAVIPPRSNRTAPRDYDRHRYEARHLIENHFCRIKQFRRIATRYEKLAVHFAAMLTCVYIIICLA